MGFNGYFKLGETEIINSARTQAYVDALMPSFGLRGCDDCEGLTAAVGDGEVLSAFKRLSEKEVVINRWRNPAPRVATATGFAAYGPGIDETGTTTYAHNGTTGVARENLLAFPYSMNPGAFWSYQAGTGEVLALSNSATGGPDNLVQGYIRRTVTTAKTATSSSGQFYRESGMTGLSGDLRMFSAWVRYSVATTVSLGVQYRVGATIVSATNFTSVLVPANTWVLLQGQFAATGAYDTVQIWPTTQQIMPVGATYDMAAVGAENPLTFKGNIFHSGSAAYFDQGTVHVTFAAATSPARAQMLYGTSPGATLSGQPWFGRRVIQVPKSSGSAGWQATSGTTRAYFSAPVGSILSAAASIRFIYSDGMSIRLRMYTYDSAGSPLQQLDSAPYVVNSGDTARMEISFPVTQEFASVGVWAFQTSGGGSQSPAGASIVDFGSIFVSTDAPSSYPWFDGGFTNTEDTDYAWTGGVSNSASSKRVYNMGREVLQSGGYHSPLVDDAPWLDSSNPSLTDFWGVYPLAVDGLDDSTRTTTVTELTTDGAVMSIPRARAREIRYDAVLVGKDAAAVDAGFHWLNRALDAVRCDNTDLGCTGTELDFFSSCPPLCDYSSCSDLPVDWSYPRDDFYEEQAMWSGAAGATVGQFPSSYTFETCSWTGLRLRFADLNSRISRRISGLIPGQRYILDMRAAAVGFERIFVASMRGLNSEVEVVGADPCPWTSTSDGPWVLEFVAQGATAILEFTTELQQTAGQAAPSADLYLTDIKVQRVGAPVTAYQTSFPNDGSDANGWSRRAGTLPANVSFLTGRQYTWQGALPLTATWTASAAAVLPAATGLTRPLRGLTVGNTYKVRVFVASSSVQPTNAAQNVAIQVSDTPSGSAVPLSGGEGWVEHTFTATSERHTLSVVRPASTSLAAGASYRLSLAYARVARVYAGDQLNAVTAGDVERYKRTLYQVTALTGPTITERYDKEAGHMMRVSFGLVAGVPHQFGPMKEVGSALGGSSINVNNVDCVEGQAVRRNLISNPSVETNLTGWSAPSVGTVLSRPNLGVNGAPAGNYAIRLTGMTTQSFLDYDTVIPVLGGAQYMISTYLRRTGAQVLMVQPWLSFYDSAGQNLGIVSGFLNGGMWVPPFFTWDRYSMPFLAPQGAVNMEVSFHIQDRDESTNPIDPVDSRIEWDAVMVEDGNALTGYFDGSFPNASWTGTANASPSIWVAPSVSELIDPDCPPLPSPPAPPQITDGCIDQPDTWTRYSIDVPASDVPLFSSALPVVNIATGNASARQLRMRWYPNQGNKEVGELEPCNYEGEIIVSYMPPDGEMEINAITRQASAVTSASTIPQTATQLLYGPDGGPMIWPELSCNVPYIFTLDVDSASSVAELDVQLSLGLKV